MIYWDTSCVLKLYTNECDSEDWARFAMTGHDGFVSSALLDLEMACALLHKEARGELLSGGSRAVLDIFRNDVKAGRFVLSPMGADVLSRAGDVAAQCLRHAEPVRLRTLDALHLATAVLLKCRVIATADARMRAAAPLLGMQPA